MRSLSRGLLIAALSVGYVAWHGHAHAAFAKGGGDDDEEGGGDDDGGSKGGDEDEGGDDADKDQPAVTAGGLFTLQSYPVSEIARPLTMTRGITQARLGVGTDISDKGAFSSAGVSLEGLYGVTDNVTVRGGFTSAYNMKQFGLYGGFEGAIKYDLLDFRAGLRLSRTAQAELCTNCMDSMGNPLTIPDGNYSSGPTDFALDLGLPFRYAVKPEVALVAFDTLMAINFTRKPDLLPSLGVATNPIPEVSVVVFAQVQIRNSDTTNGFFVPATARVEVSPSQKLDVGLEFTFLNIKPPDPQNFYDSRFLNLFVQARM
jgi:hypothetical protein